MNRYKLKDISLSKLEYGSGAAACEYDGKTRYVRITDIGNEGTLGTDVVSPNSVDDKYLLNDGDVLFARTGATVGKTYLYRSSAGRCIYAGFLIRVVPNQKIIRPDYLYYFTKSPQYKGFVKNSMKIVAQPNINAKQYGDLEFNVPSLEEQDLIIKKLNTISSLIILRRTELTRLDELIKARFVELFGDPISNNFGWKQVLLREVTSKIGSGATPRGGKESYQTEGITLIRSMNVHDGRFEYKDLAHITDEQATQLNNVMVKEGDVFINITGASVARSCIVPSNALPARVNQHVAIIRCIYGRLHPVFVNYMFLNDRFKRHLLDIGDSGGATRQAITKQQLENLVVILPPMILQHKFAAFVEQTDKSKVAVQKSLDKTQQLFDSLMQKYFG